MGETTPQSEQHSFDFSSIEPIDDAKLGYGKGQWYYPKSLECADFKHVFRQHFSAAERDLFDTITTLAFFKESWAIRAAHTYLSKACGGNPAPRTVEAYLRKFRAYGLLELKHFDKHSGNVYLVCPILMWTQKAKELSHYHFAARLLERVRAMENAPRMPQVRRKNAKITKRSTMTRDEQLAVVKRISEAEQAALSVQ